MQQVPVEVPVYGVQFKEDNYYRGSLPCFYNASQFEATKYVEANWQIMRDEILEYLQSGKEFIGSTSPNSPGLSSPNAWKRMYFMNSMWLQPANCNKLPKTWSILKKIPGITLGAALILDPHSQIHAHSSESNINVRCHIGIKIPAALPECGMRVGSEERGWQEGKVLMFSDCHNHTVWNNTGESRIIVAFDILHQQYQSRRTWLCAKYLGALTVRSLDTLIPFRKWLPQSATNLFHNLVSLVWFAYLPLQRVIFSRHY